MKLFPALDLSTEAEAQASGKVTSAEASRASKYNHSNRLPLYNSNDPTRSDRYIHIERYQYGAPDGSFHVSESDLIVYGRIVSTTPHLTTNGGNVYSTFVFSPKDEPLKGSVALNTSLLLEREGGVVRYPSGSIRMEGIEGKGLPEPGKDYLLFLRKENADYSIVAGFYIDGAHPEALDARDDTSTPSSKSALLDGIRAKVESK